MLQNSITMAYNSNNTFAKILRGESPCFSVYEDLESLAFMDIFPQSEGHVLVIPKAPAETIFDLDPEGLSACILTVKKVAAAVQQVTQASGIYIGQANGRAAGQVIPHCHFHVIPRNGPRVAARPRLGEQRLRELAQQIAAAICPM